METHLVSRRQDREHPFSRVITTRIKGEDARGSHMQLFQLHSFVFFPFKKDQVYVPRESVSEVNKNKFFSVFLFLIF